MPGFTKGYLLEILPGSTEIFIVISLLILLVLGVFKGDSYTRNLGYLCITVLLIAVAMIFYAKAKPGIAFNGLFIRSPFTGFCKISILLTVSAVLFMSLKPMERDEMGRFEYPILVLLSTLGMMLMVSANDLMSMYMALELQSLSLYILVALKKNRLVATEASIKYFILGALASSFILYGSSFLYGLTGTTEFSGLLTAFEQTSVLSSPALMMGVIFLLAGIAFKLAIVPMHMWSPDVYEGSPTPITALIASAPKLAAFALLIRLFVSVLGDLNILWEQCFIVLAILSMALGAFGALFQTNIKRVLGYSAISHMGYAVLGLLGKTYEGIQSVLIYLVLYLLMTVGIFACLLNLRKNGKAVEKIADFSGLSRDCPLLAASFTIFLFSLAGIPPLAGFFAKLGVFNAAVDAGYFKVAIFGVLMSVVSAGYYLKIIKTIYFEDNITATIGVNFDRYVFREAYMVMSVTALVTTLYVLYPSVLMNGARMASLALFNRGFP